VGHGVGQRKTAKINPVKKLRKQEKSHQNRRIPAGFWSCYPDLNWGPHPYQQAKKIFYNLFGLFLFISVPVRFLFDTF